MIPSLTACSYNLFHAPSFAEGKLASGEGKAGAAGIMRSFAQACAYPPNQAFIGNVDPRRLPARPWHSLTPQGVSPEGRFGRILGERELYALIKLADTFGVVVLDTDFRDEAVALLQADAAIKGADLSRFGDCVDGSALQREIDSGALPLRCEGKLLGCVRSAHPSDENLCAATMLENLSCKATGIYALRRLIANSGIDPSSIDYIIETSEEACGDSNQRGGGNFAKAVGELCGLPNASGSDVRAFCAAPVHGLLQAASHISAGTFRKVVVIAGGATAKLAMNAKKHIDKGFPVLEDCLASFAILVEGDAESGLVVRNDIAGMLRIGSGSSPQAVMQDLVAEPLSRAGLRFADIDFYAPELQNPEITEAAGAGNVTLANLKMIAAMAVMKKEIEKGEMDSFIASHGTAGWAPTQGHIPSGIPALGWFLSWAEEGVLARGLVIGKGSLFLGRMTGLFDGMSILLEARKPGSPAARVSNDVSAAAQDGIVRIGLTIPGSESGAAELRHGKEEAETANPSIRVVLFGADYSDPIGAHREMEDALANGKLDAAVTFHYPFPVGVATVGHLYAPGNGRDLFIATTTGTTSTDRVEALMQNAICGIAAAKAYGIPDPSVGFLNLDGAARALSIMRDLIGAGYRANLCASMRGDSLLRGNDVLAGSVDVVVCDSLTGNTIIKLISSFSSGGKIEVVGGGYGPAIGSAAAGIVGIISRATSSAVVANALLLMAKMVRGRVREIYSLEHECAERAGLSGRLSALREGKAQGAPSMQGPAAPPIAAEPHREQGSAGSKPTTRLARKVVHHEIEGIDVLEIDRAVELLQSAQIYCEPAMGCAGPIVLVSEEDADAAAAHLKGAGLL